MFLFLVVAVNILVSYKFNKDTDKWVTIKTDSKYILLSKPLLNSTFILVIWGAKTRV